MNLVTRIGLSLTIAAAALIGCAPQDSGDEADNSQGAASQNQGCGTNAEIAFHDIQKTLPAVHPDEFNPEFKSCETNIQIIQVSGTANDAAVNKLLGSDLLTKTWTCDYPETNDGSVVLKFMQKDILVTEGPGSWYGGGAHPEFGIEFKNIDLKTGKEITLDQIVKEDARDTILRSLRAQIGNQKQPVYNADNTLAKTASGRPKTEPLDPTIKDSLLMAANSAFGPGSSLKEHRDFAITAKGIRIDLINHLPHAIKSADAGYFVKYKTLEGKIVANSPVSRLITP